MLHSVAFLSSFYLLLLVNPAVVQSACDGKCCPNGKLKVKGTKLVGSDDQEVQLRGMSLYWSSFPEGKDFFNEETVKCLKDNWKADIVRATIGVETISGNKGYIDSPETEMAKAKAVVEAAIKNCMYVLVDFHAHEKHTEEAKKFFKEISAMCAGKCNCLYETWNEPIDQSWSEIKSYHEEVIKEIRKNDPDGIVIAGTPKWDQDVDVAANDKLSDPNVMYTLHFYAGSHKEDLRDKARKALAAGAPIFVSEYGTTTADGQGGSDMAETKKWYDFMDENKISSINWSIGSKGEGSMALQKGATPADVCTDAKDSEPGKFVKSVMKEKNTNPDKCGENAGAPSSTTPPPISSTPSSTLQPSESTPAPPSKPNTDVPDDEMIEMLMELWDMKKRK